MSINPEAYERSRAAVAVSCLRWLECTGSRTTFRPRPTVRLPIAEPLVRIQELPEPTTPPTHPLWDRWLDG